MMKHINMEINNYVLQTQKLSKKFSHAMAVNHVDMTIKKGDIYGFIGENGAGKTTFMRMIAGLAAPTSGTIKLFGQDNLQAGRAKIGCTIETPTLYSNLTAIENMELFRRSFGIQDNSCTERILEVMELSNTGKKRVRNFSLGMKQRLAISIALLGDPEFLILDEPVNGLDPTGIQELRNLFLRLNQEQHITLLISSHILGELSKIATRYGAIHKGLLVSEFSANELHSRCEQHLKVRVNNVEQALITLKEALNISHYEVQPDNVILLFEYIGHPEKVSRALLQENISLFELTVCEKTLEDYFNQLVTGGNKE